MGWQRLMLTTARHRLANWVERDRDPDTLTRYALNVGPDIIGALGPNQPAIGINLRGDPFGIDLTHNPHAMLIGASGKGKSTTARTYLCGRLRTGTRIIVLEAAKVGDYRYCEHQVSRVKTEAGITAALKWLVAERQRRQNAVDTYTTPDGNGVDHYGQIPGNDGPIDLVAEEIKALIGKGNRFDKAVTDKWFTALAEVASLGRSADIHLIAVTQIGTLISFGTNETANGLRSSVQARITHDTGRQNLEVLTDGLSAPTLQVQNLMEQGGKGRVAYVGCDAASDGEIQVGQIVPLTQAQARREAESYAGPEPIRFDPTIKEFSS